MYDFCYRNGFVFDPETESFIKKDLYVKGGFIAASEEDWEVRTVIDAEGKYVVPGLIDEHLHLDLNGSMIGVNGDTVCVPNGITTACDGGTCGASNFAQFYNSNIIRYEGTYLFVSECFHIWKQEPVHSRGRS